MGGCCMAAAWLRSATAAAASAGRVGSRRCGMQACAAAGIPAGPRALWPALPTVGRRTRPPQRGAEWLIQSPPRGAPDARGCIWGHAARGGRRTPPPGPPRPAPTHPAAPPNCRNYCSGKEKRSFHQAIYSRRCEAEGGEGAVRPRRGGLSGTNNGASNYLFVPRNGPLEAGIRAARERGEHCHTPIMLIRCALRCRAFKRKAAQRSARCRGCADPATAGRGSVRR